MVATVVFLSAVVQNSRKWKVDRDRRKKGTRQMGLWVKMRMETMPMMLAEKAMPRQNARRAIPESALGCPG